MPRDRDSLSSTLIVATVLCVVCSVLVAGAAVGLRPRQEANKILDRQKNVVLAAGLLKPDEITPEKIDELFGKEGRIKRAIVDLDAGKEVSASDVPFNLEEYDSREASTNPKLSEKIPAAEDLAGIKRREKYAIVYKVLSESGQLQQLVVPIYGKGLWSTLYGYLALEKNLNTVDGITYYEQGETPGLGAEVQNPEWTAKWIDKSVYDPQGDVELSVIKGKVKQGTDQTKYQVDGLSGATITSNGVTNMIHYWLGANGFEPYLKNLRKTTQGNTSGGING